MPFSIHIGSFDIIANIYTVCRCCAHAPTRNFSRAVQRRRASYLKAERCLPGVYSRAEHTFLALGIPLGQNAGFQAARKLNTRVALDFIRLAVGALFCHGFRTYSTCTTNGSKALCRYYGPVLLYLWLRDSAVSSTANVDRYTLNRKNHGTVPNR